MNKGKEGNEIKLKVDIDKDMIHLLQQHLDGVKQLIESGKGIMVNDDSQILYQEQSKIVDTTDKELFGSMIKLTDEQIEFAKS